MTSDLEPTGDENTDIKRGQEAMDDLFLRLPAEADNMIEFTQLTRVYRDANDRVSIPPVVMNTWIAASIGKLELRIVAIEKKLGIHDK
jgi:hypothetical protein